MIRTQANSKTFPKNYSKTTKDSKIEKAGYYPAKIQIENMILAGQRLKQNRQESYHYPDGVINENDTPDPTMSGEFDLADATAQLNSLNAQAEAIQAEIDVQTQEQTVEESTPEEPGAPQEA